MHRPVLVAILVLAAAHPAAADDTEALFSAPVVLGYEDQHQGFVYGLRPELIFALSNCSDGSCDIQSALGFGVYGEVDRIAGDTILGAGVTVMRYGHRLSFGPSLGVYRGGDQDGVAASLFVGLRVPVAAPFDLPFGIRVEGRWAGGDDMLTDRSAFLITAQLDVLVGIALVVYVAHELGKRSD